MLLGMLCAALLLAPARADKIILELKDGSRVNGRFLSETNGFVTFTNALFGLVKVPLAEISKQERLPDPPPPAAPAPAAAASTNQPAPAIAAAAPSTNSPAAKPAPSAGTNSTAAVPAPKKKEPAEPMRPANPEATPIASTPRYWKHDLRFGLNLRYSSRDSQDFSATAKSTYGKAPFRHIFDLNFRYGELDGNVSANSLTGSEKTEYQLSPKTYLFNVVGAGYDEIRRIDLQYEAGPGFGMELLKLTNFVWKTEAGFNFQRQYRDDDTRNSLYSVRVAEIFAWRIWEKLTADAKIEFFPNLEDLGEYRFRLESTLRYPVSKLLSLNLDVIDLYDTDPARNIPKNDLQIRSSLGITF
jgi:putative salt-induced outer membrane protein YdiY